MPERLRPNDVTFLGEETAHAPLHNATLEIFDALDEAGEQRFGYEALVSLIADRIDFVPRYRQRIRQVPGRLAMPVWVDEDDFDLGYHVRRSALPRPGSMEQLWELVARIMSRRLDPQRPLWELYVVEGLEGDRVALLSKSHQALVDGISTVDLLQVLLDTDPDPRDVPCQHWEPEREPSSSALLVEALRDSVRRPRVVLDGVRVNAEAVGRTARGALAMLGELSGAARRPHPETPLAAELSAQRRVLTVKTDFAAHRAVKEFHHASINDVVLATVTGALRAWLMTRGEAVNAGRSLRAMVPMSVIDDEAEPTSLGSQVAGHLLDLPIGEASPVVRLHQVSYAFRAHKDTGRAVSADKIAGVSGFAPTTFHALGSRVAVEHRRRNYDLVVTHVPGPQFPLYAAGARMVETYPVPPLLPGRALAIGVTSYDGLVSYGITADRDAIWDIEVLGQCITEALEELVDSASETRQRAPRGRARPGAKEKS